MTTPNASSHLNPDALLAKLLAPISHFRTSQGKISHNSASSAKMPMNFHKLNDKVSSGGTGGTTFGALHHKSPYVPSAHEIRSLLSSLKPHLSSLPNVLTLNAPLVIVGDIHGQYYDFLEMLLTTGQPPHVNMLFMGDIIDRGYYSIQTICLLLCFMLKYPSRVHLIRGNHESENTSKVYGFWEECVTKYGEDTQVHAWFWEVFNLLPIACTIDSSLFAVHGGLSPSIESVDQIKVLDRFRDVPTEGAFADLLWSDPGENLESGFIVSPRGAGYLFAEDVLSHFLHLNRFEHLTRAHQLAQEGYRVYWNDKMSTIWSAPNYTYRCGNLASVMSVDEEGNREYVQFTEAPASMRSVPEHRRSSVKSDYFR
uniref:Serine/threonine-protein phosphatase n=1 Tax=Percolomonas cosmopolitus TaxID=63605 RepID=A0A7S1KUX9_9EUKA